MKHWSWKATIEIDKLLLKLERSVKLESSIWIENITREKLNHFRMIGDNALQVYDYSRKVCDFLLKISDRSFESIRSSKILITHTKTLRCGFFMCANRSPPRPLNRFTWNFSSTRAIAWGTFRLPVRTYKPEVGCLTETGSWKLRNRKSKNIWSESSSVFVMRVPSSFFDFSNLSTARIIFVWVCPYKPTIMFNFSNSWF